MVNRLIPFLQCPYILAGRRLAKHGRVVYGRRRPSCYGLGYYQHAQVWRRLQPRSFMGRLLELTSLSVPRFRLLCSFDAERMPLQVYGNEQDFACLMSDAQRIADDLQRTVRVRYWPHLQQKTRSRISWKEDEG